MSGYSLPSHYVHITYDQPGQPDVLRMVRSPLPVIQGDQVLIKVYAAGVNGPDIAQRKGLYPSPEGASPILGLEVAGEIVKVGDGVTRWQLGDKVCALVPGGGYGEYVATYAEHCLPIPEGWRYQEASAIVETFFTVWGNLFMRAGLKAGETVLIHGGSGGIGSAAIVLAKAFGAHVIATSGSEDKCHYCRGLGADVAINYHDDFVEQVMDYTQERGVEVVLDIAGGDFINQNLKALALDGRMVSVAMQRGAKAEVDIFRIMAKRLTWTGSTLRPQSVTAKAEIAEQLLEKVWPLLANDSGNLHQLKPHVFAEFVLVECAKAHSLMESGNHRGKLVLVI
ncbi:NAD(P)H-quinone oxidoreductase [Shewanella sp. D64]|uniref:NAD(P)H-quinone oxidoreductase n=1 Tax=unclassified Shewanella TaxID=196818 RepID=UPI0022BA209A|nr:MULTISPECIES: NAD(P)H-quinone oxidoreductase [unclassified Shewanella]MEC4726057.1 NAD(P)H-quinone oxidoreductase [Shewanella sp. D64]MEC4738026.1 NAD(P)H-quinone oxidoreductase [Shewanella sp. E94]WBJ96223.1 NAD(P)H-quinone oxidoreductase [Shewanella sp. MTB7]